MDNLIERTEMAVADHFNIDQKNFHEKNLLRDVTDAKHFLWYVLYNVLGYPINEITKRYGMTRRNFFYAVSTIKDCSKTQKFYADHLSQILGEMKEKNIF